MARGGRRRTPAGAMNHGAGPATIHLLDLHVNVLRRSFKDVHLFYLMILHCMYISYISYMIYIHAI